MAAPIVRALGDTVSAARRNLICGRHSGFPLCCVAFFSLVWFPLRAAGRKRPAMARLTRPYIRLVNRIRERRDGRGWGRLPCPLCLLRNNPTTPEPCACWDRSAQRG